MVIRLGATPLQTVGKVKRKKVISLGVSPITAKKKRRTKKETRVIIAKGVLTGATLAAGGLALGVARTGALALGALKGLVGTPKRAALTVTGIGILQTSPKARTFIKGKLTDPTGTGREIGKIIEDPSKLQPSAQQTPLEKIKETAKTAGLIGGGAALAAAVVAATKAFRERGSPKAALPSGLPVGIPSAALPVAILPAEPSLSTRTQPLGAVQPQPEPTTTAQPVATMPDIKITNKPEIDIRFSKSRKFINQQVLVKP